jgi:predicted nucleotidyltransferase
MNQEIIAKLGHLPEKSRNAVIGFSDRLVEVLGGNLVSLLLYGSAVKGEYIEGKSDINLLVTLQSVHAADLIIIMKEGKKFLKAGLAVPLVFEKGHIDTSLDTFPIEFSDMKLRHILLYGIDQLENAVVEKVNLRYQCERELKSIIVNLRRGFLRTDAKKEHIRSLLEGSLSSVLAACKGLIWLSGKTPPDNIDSLFEDIHGLYGADTSAIRKVWHLKKGKGDTVAVLEALFDDYITDIARLAEIADKM